MIDLKEYQERKDLLARWYDRVIGAHQLLQSDVDDLREAKSNLYDDRFVVAVCGGMNSGKSTLLNALLFEKEVLPSHVTTMTAKIALMEGDTKERIEATLYTPDEFQRVKEACNSDGLAKAELDEARETARAEGLKETELLTEPPQVRSEDGLGGLSKFAAVCSEGGVYSVFVKSVRLWADRPWLHKVTVADTPGTDDPNPERDKITREWIQQADAVVYVTFAGQAGMTGSDMKFLDEHLAHIDPGQRIIAVNKCDQEPNTEAIWNHIRKIRNSDDLRMKYLFGDEDQIVLVSGLGALISAMKHAGRPLSDDMKWHANRMSSKGYLKPELHGLEKLRGLIENRIIQSKGDGIIKTHQRRLDSVFERASRRFSRMKAVLNDSIDFAKASANDRAEERKKVSDNITSIASHIKEARIVFEKELEKAHSLLHEKFKGVQENILRKTHEEIENVRTIRNLAGEARWALSDAVYEERLGLQQPIRSLVGKVEEILDGAESQLSAKLLQSDLGARFPRTHLLPISARTICMYAEARFIDHLDREFLNEVIEDATTWWQRIFDTNKGQREAAEGLKPHLGETLQKCLDDINGETYRVLLGLGQKALKEMQESCSGLLDDRLNHLGELDKDDVADEERVEKLRKELREVAKRSLEVASLRAEYEKDVNR